MAESSDEQSPSRMPDVVPIQVLYRRALNFMLDWAIKQWRTSRYARIAVGVLGCGVAGLSVVSSVLDYGAIRALREAAEKGDPKAQVELATDYTTWQFFPVLIPNATKSASWLRKAADQREPDAEAFLALAYAGGSGVPQDNALYRRWVHQSAEDGSGLGQYLLARTYDKGYNDMVQNEVEAAGWYRKAAEQGVVEAQLELGDWYAIGKVVPRDEAEAVVWYRKAADLGSAGAQMRLGQQYAAGEGVPRDDVEAYKWFVIASRSGASEAAAGARSIARRLTNAQVSDGSQRAQDWQTSRRTVAASRTLTR